MKTLTTNQRTKSQMISEVTERTNVLDQDMGYIIQTKEGEILDNTECTKAQLRSAVAIEDWNYEENLIWGVFTK